MGFFFLKIFPFSLPPPPPPPQLAKSYNSDQPTVHVWSTPTTHLPLSSALSIALRLSVSCSEIVRSALFASLTCLAHAGTLALGGWEVVVRASLRSDKDHQNIDKFSRIYQEIQSFLGPKGSPSCCRAIEGCFVKDSLRFGKISIVFKDLSRNFVFF